MGRRVRFLILIVLLTGCRAAEEAVPAAGPKPPPPPATTASPPETTPSLPPDTTTTTHLPTPVGVNPGSPCLERAVFEDPADSAYLLPFPVGEEHYLSQSYCFSEGGHRNQLAYDFDLPVGAAVLAARAGVVRSIKQDSPDDGQGYGNHNYVFIEHEDGTVAFYAHLMQDGVKVAVGDEVAAGDEVALAGNSGLTGHPHLHFGVYQDWPPREGEDVAVNFRNARGQHDSRNGLVSWRLYIAMAPD
jgi:murein DD-endopeptidase MepM/ murein hydrolase activator NlpD